MIDGTQAKKLSLLGGDYNLSSLITVISSNQFRMSISNSIKLFAGTRQPDNVIQTDTAPARVDEYVVPPPAPTCAATASFSAPAAPVPSDTLAAPAQVSKYVAPAPDVTHAAPARVDCVAPALVVEYIAPARVAPGLQPPRVNFDIPGLMNPQFSTTFVEASTPKAVPVSLAHQEQIVAEEVVERIQEQIGSERIEEQIRGHSCPSNRGRYSRGGANHSQEHLQQRTVDQEQIIAGETTRNIVRFHSVQEQAKVLEFPEVHFH